MSTEIYTLPICTENRNRKCIYQKKDQLCNEHDDIVDL